VVIGGSYRNAELEDVLEVDLLFVPADDAGTERESFEGEERPAIADE
jgi:hypothetical protein